MNKRDTTNTILTRLNDAMEEKRDSIAAIEKIFDFKVDRILSDVVEKDEEVPNPFHESKKLYEVSYLLKDGDVIEFNPRRNRFLKREVDKHE